MSRPRHDSHLLIYCSEGRGQLYTANHAYPVGPGDLLFLPAGMAHSYKADPEQPWTIYWVHYRGQLAEHYNQLFAGDSPLLSLGPQPRLVAEFEALYALRSAGYALPEFIHAACQLKQMLSLLGNLVVRHGGQPGQAIDLDYIQQLMHRNLDGKLDLASLAAECQLSKYHFARRFKQLTGHSPIQHFIHLKIEHACQLLDSSEDSVKQIAWKVGYQDPYYFSRLFKQVIGQSPRQYRTNRQT